MTKTKQDELHRRLRQARVRLDAAAPYSPDWDAAMAELEELERLLIDVDLGAEGNALAPDGAPVAV